MAMFNCPDANMQWRACLPGLGNFQQCDPARHCLTLSVKGDFY